MDNSERGQYVLAIGRILIGWMFLWAFLDKMFGLGYETPAGQGVIDGGSPSSYVEYMTSGLFEGLFKAIAGNGFIDFLLMAGLLILGITITLGIFTKITTISSIAFFLTMFCIVVPPADNPLIDYHVVYLVFMIAVYYLGGYDRLSLFPKWKELPMVKEFPIIE